MKKNFSEKISSLPISFQSSNWINNRYINNPGKQLIDDLLKEPKKLQVFLTNTEDKNLLKYAKEKIELNLKDEKKKKILIETILSNPTWKEKN